MADVGQEQSLPHNLEAERSVLGAVLIRNDTINHATEVIDAHDFFREAHRVIFDTMIALNGAGPVHLQTGLCLRAIAGGADGRRPVAGGTPPTENLLAARTANHGSLAPARCPSRKRGLL